jgi:K+/H+ antiporter YhaU regulatory subunit KhtT
MLKNINYNLIETVSIISRSLYRYDTYIKDASECKSCQEIWSKFKEQREKELSMILKELKAHIDAGKVSFG